MDMASPRRGSPGSRYGGHVGSAAEGNGRAACDPEGPAVARIRIHHPAAPGVDGAHVGASAAAIIDPMHSPESALNHALLQLVLTLPVLWSGRHFI